MVALRTVINAGLSAALLSGLATAANAKEMSSASPAEPGDVTALFPARSSYSEAVHWLRQGKHERAYAGFAALAEQGDARAMRQLGLMNASGIGRPGDPQAALAWFERAATAGDAPSMLILGTVYAKGLGVAADRDRAIHWLQLARKSGDPDIQGKAADLLRQL